MWTTPLWSPPQDLSPAEEKIAARAAKTKKLFVVLREVRTERFDPTFQEELAGMDRQTGAGKPPVPPALLAMATRLQADTGVGDQEAVELTLDSTRWQVVLDSLGSEAPWFSQGALFDFRRRLMNTGRDQRLLERTVERARTRGGFDAKPWRLALDSSPLWGHGRVKDTFNWLGHAARQVIACLAELTQHEVASVMEPVGLTLFDTPRLKAGLDINWDDAEQKPQALQRLCDEVDALPTWIGAHVPVEVKQPPLAAAVATLQTLMAQDLEPEPTGGGTRIREGVVNDRQISLEDAELRHGRKSAAKRVDGYKRHLARDMDEQLILAAETLPATTAETAGVAPLLVAVEWQHRNVTSLPIDRGYLGEPLINTDAAAGVVIVCKPWPGCNPAGHCSKLDFQIDVVTLQATCPAGQVVPITPGKTAGFPAAPCQGCPPRAPCTSRATGGRTLIIHPQEDRLQRLRVLPTTAAGRAALRERVAVEHSVAHRSQRQENRARYHGTRNNTGHRRRVSAIQNLERAQALSEQAQTHEVPQRLAA